MSTATRIPPAVRLSDGDALARVHGLVIPARPAILAELSALLARDSADFRTVGDLVARDVTLAAAMLKTVNSPAFGLSSRCGSVHTAVQLLGLRNAATLVTALSMRQFAQPGQPSFERFWDSAEKQAGIAAFISSLLPRVSRDDCYAFSLFRDAGIPLLMMKWPSYRETLQRANGDPRPLTVVEEEAHGTHHAVVGYLMARSWNLPEVICEAIQCHHDPALYHDAATVRPAALTLISVARLAENLHARVLTIRADPEWERLGPVVLGHLGLSPGEYQDLVDEVESLKL